MTDKLERIKFTTTLKPNTIRKLGIMAAIIDADRNDVIEILVDAVDEGMWGRDNELEKKRRNIE